MHMLPMTLPPLTPRRAARLFADPQADDDGAATAEYAIATMATVDKLERMKGETMGKKNREVIAARVMHEQQWAFDRRSERLTWRAIAELSGQPVERGGLGYPLGQEALKRRSDAYFERVKATLQTGVEERRARQEAEVDELIRLAVADIQAARAAGDVKASAEAEARLVRYQEREAKIFGTDAPQRLETTVTTRDGILDELNSALASIGVDERVKAPKKR